MERTDPFGQPVGRPLPGWTPRPRPPRTPMEGRLCRVEPLDPDRHAADLFGAYAEDEGGRMWTYMGYGPFEGAGEFRAWTEACARGDDPLFHAILGPDGRAAGVASYLRADAENGAIEVGHIALSPRLARTAAATEAMYLMMRRVFDELGYRRYEWKCDALNAPSRAAAARLGFSFEGVFRQAMVTKGRNRDTAWHSILDGEWPAARAGFERWLDPLNFDAEGRRRAGLASLRAGG